MVTWESKSLRCKIEQLSPRDVLFKFNGGKGRNSIAGQFWIWMGRIGRRIMVTRTKDRQKQRRLFFFFAHSWFSKFTVFRMSLCWALAQWSHVAPACRVAQEEQLRTCSFLRQKNSLEGSGICTRQSWISRNRLADCPVEVRLFYLLFGIFSQRTHTCTLLNRSFLWGSPLQPLSLKSALVGHWEDHPNESPSESKILKK